MKGKCAAWPNERVQVSVGMHRADHVKIRAAEEREIAFREHAKLEHRNQRDLRAPRHAHFLAAHQVRRGLHVNGNDLRPQTLIRSGTNLSPGRGQRSRAARRWRNGILGPGDPHHRRLIRAAAQSADFRGRGGLHGVEGRRQVGGHFFNATIGGVKGQVILQIGPAHLAFGIGHHQQADRDPRQQQEHEQGCNQRETSGLPSRVFHSITPRGLDPHRVVPPRPTHLRHLRR